MVFGQNRAAMTGKVLPSGWLRVVRVEIYFVTINGSDEEGDGGKGRDVKRETFLPNLLLILQNSADVLVKK